MERNVECDRFYPESFCQDLLSLFEWSIFTASHLYHNNERHTNHIYGQRKGQKIHFYKINGYLNSTKQNNIIYDHKCKTNSLLCNINIHKINQRCLYTNQTNKKKTNRHQHKTSRRTTKTNARWRVGEKLCAASSQVVHRPSRT